MTEAVTNRAPEGAENPWTPGAPLEAPTLGLELSEEQVIAELRSLLAHERAERLEAEAKAAAARERERRYERALTTLEGPKETSPAKSPYRGYKPQPGEWHVSDEKVEQVWRRFLVVREEVGEPLSPGHLAKMSSRLSAETARRALNTLREREQVRLVGTGRGGGKLYDVMPGADDGA